MTSRSEGGGEGQGFCEHSARDLVIKSVTMGGGPGGRGVKNCPKLRDVINGRPPTKHPDVETRDLGDARDILSFRCKHRSQRQHDGHGHGQSLCNLCNQLIVSQLRNVHLIFYECNILCF